jgi:hypothetical protein
VFEARLKGSRGILCAATLLVCALHPVLQASEASASRGNLIGFIYGQDETTPVSGAIVTLKSIETGSTFESVPTDSLGIFRMSGLVAGVYAMGVASPAGGFNATSVVGVKANETAKVSVALQPYEQQVAQAVAQVNNTQTKAGQSRVGRVIEFLPGTVEGQVFIELGLLQQNDRIRVLGERTDFYQDVKSLVFQGMPVKRAFGGQTVQLKLIKPAEAGDIVYIVCKRGIPPIFLSPLGIAAIVAGTGAIAYGVIVIPDEPVPVSVYKY